MIALGIGLEEYEYPYPVQFLPLTNDLQPVTMGGQAFGCYYFHDVIEALTGAGYHLGTGRVAVLGHSAGGMTATRFTLMNPDRVTHMVLEDPLGLADYRTGIPPQSEETLFEHERHWTDPKVIRDYVAGYFVHPDPSVWEPLADVLSPDRAAPRTAQPVPSPASAVPGG